MSFSDFVKPYPNGYIDGEAGNTPVTAAILNTNYDGFLLQLNDWATDIEEDIGSIQSTLNDKVDTSTFNQLGEAVRQIGLAVNSKSTVSISDLLQSGTKIATLTIDSTPYDIYAPSGGGGGSSVVWDQIQQTGTKIATITIDNVPVDVYVPTPIEELSDLTDVSITNLQNGQTLKWNSTTLKWENSNASGGSGHTILDDSGTALSQEDNLQIKGVYSADNSQDGVTEVNVYREMTKAEFNTLSSDEKKGFIRVTDEPDIVSIIDGVFIDTDNVIQASTSISTSSDTTYTATEDCVLRYELYSTSSLNGYLKIDNNWIIETAGSVYVANVIYVKKGQTVTMRSQGSAGSYIVYGIQQGSKTVDYHEYSTDEKVVGKWIDGSTLYEKTWNNLNVDVAYNTWTNVVEVASDMDLLVDIEALSSANEHHNLSASGIEYYLDKTTHYVKAEYNQNINRRSIGIFTIRYTKSS